MKYKYGTLDSEGDGIIEYKPHNPLFKDKLEFFWEESNEWTDNRKAGKAGWIRH